MKTRLVRLLYPVLLSLMMRSHVDGAPPPTPSKKVSLCGVVQKEEVVNFLHEQPPCYKAKGVRIKRSDGFEVTFEESGGGVTFFAPEDGWDWSSYVAVAVDMRNIGNTPVTLLGQLQHSISAISFLHLPPQEMDTMVLHLMRPKQEDALFENMRGMPGGHLQHWDRDVSFDQVRNLHLRDLDGKAVGGRVAISSIRVIGSYGPLPAPGTMGFFPFVDRFGQYKHEDWPGKIHKEEDLQRYRNEEEEDLQAHAGSADRSRFGGWKRGPKREATGHFRTEKYRGKWWLVDPDGYLFWSHGVTGVGRGAVTECAERSTYFETLPTHHIQNGKIDFYLINLERKYGADWRAISDKLAHRRLRSWGMNTLGNWSRPELGMQRRTPYVVPIGVGSKESTVRKDPVRLREVLRKRFEEEIGKTTDDPWCIGYFVDNELRWKYVMEPELYFRIVREELKRVAPEKLYLGSRLHGAKRIHGGEKVLRAAVKYCDVVGINRYRFSPSDLRMPEGMDKPILIGEFHFGALDRGMLHTGLRGVASQVQRAYAYHHYLSEALRHPHIVGTHWFQYRGQAVTGRRDGENYQIGLVDIGDTPGPETIQAIRQIGEKMYEIRQESN